MFNYEPTEQEINAKMDAIEQETFGAFEGYYENEQKDDFSHDSNFRRNRKWTTNEKNQGGWGLYLAILDSETDSPIKKIFKITKVPKKLSFLSYRSVPLNERLPIFAVSKIRKEEVSTVAFTEEMTLSQLKNATQKLL